MFSEQKSCCTGNDMKNHQMGSETDRVKAQPTESEKILTATHSTEDWSLCLSLDLYIYIYN